MKKAITFNMTCPNMTCFARLMLRGQLDVLNPGPHSLYFCNLKNVAMHRLRACAIIG